MAFTPTFIFGEGLADEGTAPAPWDRETGTVRTGVEAGSADHSSAAQLHGLEETLESGLDPTTVRTRKVTIFARRFSDVTPNGQVALLYFYATGGGTTINQLLLTTAGDLALYLGDGTLVATATNPLTANAWWLFRVAVDYDAGADTLRCRVWKWEDNVSTSWGSPIIDYTQASTPATGLTHFAWVSDGDKSTAPGITDYIDDGISGHYTDEADLSAAPLDTGRIRVTRLQPTGNSATNTGFSVTGTPDAGEGASGHPDYRNVNDRPTDGASTDDGTGTAVGARDQTYTYADWSQPAGSGIIGVSIITRLSASSALGKMLSTINAVDAVPAPTLNTTITPGHWCLAVTPAAAAWTELLINGMEGGARRVSGGVDMKITQTFALVAYYDAPPVAGQPILRRSGHVPHMALGNSAVRRRY